MFERQETRAGKTDFMDYSSLTKRNAVLSREEIGNDDRGDKEKMCSHLLIHILRTEPPVYSESQETPSLRS